jgi:hypothetical protein
MIVPPVVEFLSTILIRSHEYSILHSKIRLGSYKDPTVRSDRINSAYVLYKVRLYTTAFRSKGPEIALAIYIVSY